MTTMVRERPDSRTPKPRMCFECWEEKDADEFDVGPSGFRRRTKCRACLARLEEERQERRRARIEAQKSRTWQDDDGVWWRRCTQCREEKPLHTHFAVNRRRKNGAVVYLYECRKCSSKRTTEASRWRYQVSPEARRKHLEADARWRARNPEKATECARKAWLRVKNDPVLHERRKRLKREAAAARALAEGRTPKPLLAVVPEEIRAARVPARQLATACDEYVAREVRLGNEDALGRLFAHMTVEAGQRALYAWRSGERVSVSLDEADAVLVALGLLWWDVWNEDTVRLWEYTFVRKRWSRSRKRWERTRSWTVGDRGPDLEELERVRVAFEGVPEEVAA